MSGFFYWLGKLRLSESIDFKDLKILYEKYFICKISLDKCYAATVNPKLMQTKNFIAHEHNSINAKDSIEFLMNDKNIRQMKTK